MALIDPVEEKNRVAGPPHRKGWMQKTLVYQINRLNLAEHWNRVK